MRSEVRGIGSKRFLARKPINVHRWLGCAWRHVGTEDGEKFGASVLQQLGEMGSDLGGIIGENAVRWAGLRRTSERCGNRGCCGADLRWDEGANVEGREQDGREQGDEDYGAVRHGELVSTSGARGEFAIDRVGCSHVCCRGISRDGSKETRS